MKLIVEHNFDKVYVYLESEKHHKKAEPQRKKGIKRVSYTALRNECCLGANKTLPSSNWYMVFNLKGSKNRKENKLKG